MKALILTLCFFVTLTVSYGQGHISGTWNMGKDNTIIDIKEAGGVSTGTVLSSDNADLKGDVMLKETKLVGKEWKGKLYVPKLGKWVDVTITTLDATKLSVAISAGIASRTVEWTKH